MHGGNGFGADAAAIRIPYPGANLYPTNRKRADIERACVIGLNGNLIESGERSARLPRLAVRVGVCRRVAQTGRDLSRQ